MGYKFVNHSDAIEVAKDKYGDLCHIDALSALQKGEINRARKKAYDVKCAALRVGLEDYVQTLQREEEQGDGTLSAEATREELDKFMSEHHDGYDFFVGAHDQGIADNFERKMLQYAREFGDIRGMLEKRIRDAGKRRLAVRNMTRQEIQSDFYSASWSHGRFGH